MGIGNDIDRENEASSPITITNRDETLKADLTAKGNGKIGLEVIADVNVTGYGSSGGPTLSPDSYRVTEDGSDHSINNGSFVTIYTGGATALEYFMMECDTAKYTVKLIMDGNTLFEVQTEELDNVIDLDKFIAPIRVSVQFNKAEKVFIFSPNYPIKAITDFLIQVKSNDGNKKVKTFYVGEY